ncbi:MAG: hypothetical protein H7A53_04500 [Akkermansiaceae bacterium]|nr:hypothetical protein [Akkermansiaceae bacterium]
MPIPTLKNRLIAAYLIGSAITTALAIWFVAIRLGDLFMAQLDHSLTDKMRIVRSACVQRDGRVIVELGPDLFRRMHDPEDPEFIQLSLAGGGGVLLRSPSLAGVTLERVGADSAEPSLETILLPGGEKGRAAGQFFYPIQGENAGEPIRLHLIAAHHTDRVHAATRSIVILSFQAAALSMLTLTFLSRLMVRRNLRAFSPCSSHLDQRDRRSRGRNSPCPTLARVVPC